MTNAVGQHWKAMNEKKKVGAAHVTPIENAPHIEVKS